MSLSDYQEKAKLSEGVHNQSVDSDKGNSIAPCFPDIVRVALIAQKRNQVQKGVPWVESLGWESKPVLYASSGEEE